MDNRADFSGQPSVPCSDTLSAALRAYSRDRIVQAIIETRLARGLTSGTVEVDGVKVKWNANVITNEAPSKEQLPT